MNIEEIRAELQMLENKLDIDVDIIEYLIRDIFYADNVYIIGSESCSEIVDDFIFKLKSNLFGKKIEGDSPKNKFKDTHCLLIISQSGEEKNLIEIASAAKDKGSIIYIISSNRFGSLVSFAYEFLHIRDESNFIENTQYLLSTVYNRLEYYLNNREYDVASPTALTKDSTKERLNIPKSSVLVSGYKVSHLESKKKNSEAKWMILIIIIIMWIFIFAVFYILYLLQSFMGMQPDFNKMIMSSAIMCVILTILMIGMVISMKRS